MNIKELRKKAKSGDPQAQYELGRMYLNGNEEIKKNSGTALSYLKKAAEQKHVDALRLLASFYGDKRRTKYDPRLALGYLVMLKDQGEEVNQNTIKRLQEATNPATSSKLKSNKKASKRKKTTIKAIIKRVRNKLSDSWWSFKIYSSIVFRSVLILTITAAVVYLLSKLIFPNHFILGLIIFFIFCSPLLLIFFLFHIWPFLPIHPEIDEKETEKAVNKETEKAVNSIKDELETNNDLNTIKDTLHSCIGGITATSLLKKMIIYQHYGNTLYDWRNIYLYEDELMEEEEKKEDFERRLEDEEFQTYSTKGFLGLYPFYIHFNKHPCFNCKYERLLTEYILGIGKIFTCPEDKCFNVDYCDYFESRNIWEDIDDIISNPRLTNGYNMIILDDDSFPGMNNAGKLGLLVVTNDKKSISNVYERYPNLFLYIGYCEQVSWSEVDEPIHEYDLDFNIVGEYAEELSEKEELRASQGDANAQYYMGVRCLLNYGHTNPDCLCWLNKAKEQGHKEAHGLLKLIEELEPIYKEIYDSDTE